MRTLTGVSIGITLSIIWHLLGWPLIGWIFTRIPPDAEATPRYRTWQNGIEQ